MPRIVLEYEKKTLQIDGLTKLNLKDGLSTIDDSSKDESD